MPRMQDRLVSAARDRLADVRVIYTDLDGTMLGARASFFHDPTGAPTLAPAESLLAALAADIDIVPTSGRALRGLITDGRMLSMPNVIAEMGAQLAYDYGHEVVENFGETPEPGPPARVMERLGTVALLLDRFAGSLEEHMPWSRWRECTHLFRGRVDTAEVDRVLHEEGHAWLALHDNGRLHGDYLGLGLGNARAYHLQPLGVSKGTAVALDRARRGLARPQTIAIGDAVADLTMAPEVGAIVFVRDAVESDPELADKIGQLDNALVTDRPQNLGWADTVSIAAGRP